MKYHFELSNYVKHKQIPVGNGSSFVRDLNPKLNIWGHKQMMPKAFHRKQDLLDREKSNFC